MVQRQSSMVINWAYHSFKLRLKLSLGVFSAQTSSRIIILVQPLDSSLVLLVSSSWMRYTKWGGCSTTRSFKMKKLIAVLGVIVMLGMVAGCSCHAPEGNYKGEVR